MMESNGMKPKRTSNTICKEFYRKYVNFERLKKIAVLKQ